MGRTDEEGEIPYDFLDRDARRRRLAEESRRADYRYRAQKMQREERENRALKKRTGLAVFALFLAFFCALKLYAHNYTLTTYSVDAEETRTGLAEAELISFYRGGLCLFRDSVSYMENGRTVWTENLSFTDPEIAVRGSYFVLFSRNGTMLQIFDETGLLSTVSLSRKIRTADISSTGVTAVMTRAEDAAYISYYDRYGSRISVEICALLSQTGYPLDIAISPDGQRLAAACYTLEEELGQSSLVIYDFSGGRDSQGYVIAEIDDFRETGTLIFDVGFLSDDTLAAVGNDRLGLYKIGEKSAEALSLRALGDNTAAVFFEADSLAVAERTDTGVSLSVYDETGEPGVTLNAPCEYDEIRVSGRHVLFRDGARIILMNRNGTLRYDGELTDTPAGICFSQGRTLLINTGSELRTITLK